VTSQRKKMINKPHYIGVFIYGHNRHWVYAMPRMIPQIIICVHRGHAMIAMIKMLKFIAKTSWKKCANFRQNQSEKAESNTHSAHALQSIKLQTIFEIMSPQPGTQLQIANQFSELCACQ